MPRSTGKKRGWIKNNGGGRGVKKIVFFDVDGTLLPEGTPNVPESTVRAMKKLKENDSPKPELAPISFTQHADPVFSSAVPSGVQKTVDIHPPKTGISVHFSDSFILK